MFSSLLTYLRVYLPALSNISIDTIDSLQIVRLKFKFKMDQMPDEIGPKVNHYIADLRNDLIFIL